MFACALVAVIIILLIVFAGKSRTSRTAEQFIQNASGTPSVGIPLFPDTQPSEEYCPYRSIIGVWRTTTPNSIPSITKEYEFSTLADAKTVLLRMRHILSNPPGYGSDSAFTRGTCVLTNFKCQNGFTGDVSLEAKCISSTSSKAGAYEPLNVMPTKFKVIVNSKETLLIDVDSQEEYHKYP
jgi:hypothetical protein